MLKKFHITKPERLALSWGWTCTCGANSDGYPTRWRALDAAALHRAMEMLKGDK